MKKKLTPYHIFSVAFLMLFSIAVMVPFVLLFLSSLTEEHSLIRNGYSFFPEAFSLKSYEYILASGKKIFSSYLVTIAVTVIGTLLNLSLSAMYAFGLSLKKLPGRKLLTFFIFFTMLFNGGIVPSYIMWASYLHIKDTLMALILPNFLMNAMNVLLIRTYFTGSIPEEMLEAAQIDGASYPHIFARIVLPLGKPILVTMGTFAGLAYWNDWTNSIYYISRRTDLYSIQALLNVMITNLQYLANSDFGGLSTGESAIPTAGIQMAIAFVAILPILVLFPFLQKYYSKGLMLGAVKG